MNAAEKEMNEKTTALVAEFETLLKYGVTLTDEMIAKAMKDNGLELSQVNYCLSIAQENIQKAEKVKRQRISPFTSMVEKEEKSKNKK
jgi:hypothetical protein